MLYFIYISYSIHYLYSLLSVWIFNQVFAFYLIFYFLFHFSLIILPLFILFFILSHTSFNYASFFFIFLLFVYTFFFMYFSFSIFHFSHIFSLGWKGVAAAWILTKIFSLPFLYIINPSFAIFGAILFLQTSIGFSLIATYLDTGEPFTDHSLGNI